MEVYTLDLYSIIIPLQFTHAENEETHASSFLDETVNSAPVIYVVALIN